MTPTNKRRFTLALHGLLRAKAELRNYGAGPSSAKLLRQIERRRARLYAVVDNLAGPHCTNCGKADLNG